ncbi:hypothetical protein BBJ28_00012528 [Nothophytophthora sp. Chile5]|nr:hypothetical protein BBJ28_00012528 [Nothophytophthora sp. Chile5]
MLHDEQQNVVAGDGERLRRDVLALIRTSKPPAARRQWQLLDVFARFEGAGETFVEAPSPANERGLWRTLEELGELVAFGDGAIRKDLLRAVARSGRDDGTWTRKHKRKRPQTGASGASPRLVTTWLLHTAALARLEDVLAVSGALNASKWLCRAIHELLSSVSTPLLTTSSASKGESVPLALQVEMETTHTLAGSVLQHLIRLAFGRNDAEAARVLQTLGCTSSVHFSSIAFSRVAAILTTQKVAKSEQQRVVAFLLPMLQTFLSTPKANTLSPETCQRVLEAHTSCLPAAARAQVLRQLVYELESATTSATDSQRVASIFQGVVLQFVTIGVSLKPTSSKDLSETFASQALTLAHELAEDGVQRAHGWLLRQSLELVALVSRAVTTSPSPSPSVSAKCYRSWFRDHFGSTEGVTGAAEEPNKTETRCRLAKSCHLITNKHPLQFLCAFLLDFDRQNLTLKEEETVTWTSEHVATHLSVLKTHQERYAGTAFVMDFCVQTRARFVELQKREEQARHSEAAGSGAVGARSKFSAKTRATVKENVAFFREKRRLSPKLRQWKTFHHEEWKAELLPCCLDVFGSSFEKEKSGSLMADDDRVVDQIAFVLALAKAGMLPAREYNQFLVDLQAWMERRQRDTEVTLLQHEQQALEDKLQRRVYHLRTAVMVARACGTRESLQQIIGQLQGIATTLLSGCRSHQATLGTNESEAQQRQTEGLMAKCWHLGFLDVLDALGDDHVQLFYRFQAPLVTRLAGSQGHTPFDAMAFAHYCLRQIPCDDEPVDRKLVTSLSCFGGVLTALLDAFTDRQTMEAWPVAIRERFGLSTGGAAEGESSVLPSREDAERSGVLFVAFLRALGSGKGAVNDARIELAMCSFTAPAVDFIMWLGHRVAHDDPGLAAAGGATESELRWSTVQFICRNVLELHRMEWFRDVYIRHRSHRTKEELRRMIAYEFRYGFSVFREASTGLERQLDLMADVAVSSEEVCGWVIEELFVWASQHRSEGSAASNSDESTARQQLTAPAESALILVNELLHQSKQKQEAATSIPSDTTMTAFILKQWLGKLDVMSHVDLIRRKLLCHYGFELLRVCLRSQGTAVQPALNGSTSDSLLLKIAQHVCSEHMERLPRHWLCVLLDLLPKQLKNVADLPMSFAVQVTLGSGEMELCRPTQRAPSAEKLMENSTLQHLQRWLGAFFSRLRDDILPRHSLDIKLSSDHSDTSIAMVPAIVPSLLAGAKYQIQALKWIFHWKRKESLRREGDSGPQRPILQDVAIQTLRVSSVSEVSSPLSQQLGDEDAAELSAWVLSEWQKEVAAMDQSDRLAVSTAETGTPQTPSSSLSYQLLLVHIAAEACCKSVPAARKLLRPSSSSIGFSSSIENARAVFLVLLATVACETEQLEQMLALNSLLWVNEFPRAALAAAGTSGAQGLAKAAPSTASESLQCLLGSVSSFQASLAMVMHRILTFGAEHRVDVLGSALPAQLLRAWPQHGSIIARLQVLCLVEGQ